MDDFREFFIGAYATSPTINHWEKQKEAQYYQAIKKNLNIRGLELPFWGKLHDHDEKFYLNLLDKKWDYILTTLPGTMKALSKNPHFGIASKNENGRKEAVEFLKNANLAVKKINDFFGKKSVLNVAIVSAPSLQNSQASSSARALMKSLMELIELDWQGAKLVIEHCDSGREKNPIKGFLSLQEEIEAVEYINTIQSQKIGVTINWARSVLETRSTKTPIEQIKQLTKLNLLKGVIFSGTSAHSKDYGNWTDLHLPVAKEEGIDYFEQTSLMGANEIKESLLACNLDQLDYLGIKVLSMPIDQSPLERRVGINKDTLKILKKMVKEVRENRQNKS
jgi:hypothetical protein